VNSEKLYRRVVTWSDIPEEDVRPGVRRRAYATDGCMLVMNTLQPDMQLNPHVHEDFDQLAYIVDGHCRYYIDGEPHEMSAGSMLLVPAGSPHYIEPLDGPCLNLDIFTPPRADLSHLLSYLDATDATEATGTAEATGATGAPA
jgi:quercetin dioxygenase-like cupin family protein